MKAKIAIVCHGFSREDRYKQPWYNVHGIAIGLSEAGSAIRVYSNVENSENSSPYSLEYVPELLVKGAYSSALLNCFVAFEPTAILVLVSPLKIARLRKLGGNIPSFLLVGAQRFKFNEFRRIPLVAWRLEWRLLLVPLLSSMMPAVCFRRGYRKSEASGAIFFSKKSRERYVHLGLPNGPVILPKIDISFIKNVAMGPIGNQAKNVQSRHFYYFGPPLLIRGVLTAIKCFEKVCAQGVSAKLILLLRANEDYYQASLSFLLNRIASSPFRENIAVNTNFLTKDEIYQNIRKADFVLLPFLITVSDPPVVTLEAGAAGCNLVVFDTPGVAEVAHGFGGQVASTDDDIVSFLGGAVSGHEKKALVKSENPSSHQAGIESLIGYLEAFEIYGKKSLICICGADGSGKTTILDHLRLELDAINLEYRYRWSRFRNYLSKPLLFILRLTGHNKKEVVQGVKVGYHEFQRSNIIAFSFLFLQWIDNAFDIWLRYRFLRTSVIVGDRCVIDTLVDLAIDTGKEDFVFGAYGRSLIAMLPKPFKIFVIERDQLHIKRDRPDALFDRNHSDRQRLYRRLARDFDFQFLENNGEMAAILKAICRSLKSR